ncbi:hypothetical protein Tco_0712893 [Tanacetum coccineum]
MIVLQQLLSQWKPWLLKYQLEMQDHKFLRSLPQLGSNLARKCDQNQIKSSTNKVKSGHIGAYSTCTPISLNNIQEREVPAGFANEGPQKPEISDSDDNSTKNSTCQSNDSEGSFGNPFEHSSETESESISVPNEMYSSKSDTENEKVVSESKEVEPSSPRQNMEDKGIFDSGCSGHMTGNKDHLDDFEECKGGSVTFGGSKGYITGKGRIRVGNLDFDSVSFVKELGHFNLFSISQICDKQHKVLFTKTELFIGVPDFKM